MLCLVETQEECVPMPTKSQGASQLAFAINRRAITSPSSKRTSSIVSPSLPDNSGRSSSGLSPASKRKKRAGRLKSGTAKYISLDSGGRVRTITKPTSSVRLSTKPDMITRARCGEIKSAWSERFPKELGFNNRRISDDEITVGLIRHFLGVDIPISTFDFQQSHKQAAQQSSKRGR